jgi:predicted TPR repeat methyltransferase
MSDDPGAEALAHQAAGRLDDAATAYRRAIEQTHARMAALHFNLGVVLLQLGRLDECIAVAAEACSLDRGALAEELRGAALLGAGRLDEADQAFARAAELAPERAGPWYNRAAVARQRGDIATTIAHYRAGLERVPDHLPILQSLGPLLTTHGDRDEAIAIHERTLAIAPDHVGARHLLAAARGESPPAPPPGFVSATFDGYAATFETHLRDTLQYRGPELIRAALGSERAARALDLGCGTGLAGAAVRDLVDHLDGVDASPAMITEARKKAVYDELHAADAIELLDAGGPPYDLVVAADVLIYIGELGPLFAAVRRRLAPGGRFAFTVEPSDQPGWQLAPSARYVHGRDHVEAVAAACGLAIEHFARGTLRTEREVPVPADVFVLRG